LLSFLFRLLSILFFFRDPVFFFNFLILIPLSMASWDPLTGGRGVLDVWILFVLLVGVGSQASYKFPASAVLNVSRLASYKFPTSRC
jgi:hypothetical protein